MRKGIWIGILLIRAIYYHQIMYFAEEILYDELYYSEDESIEREKIVLCFEEGMEVERRYNEEKNIILNDSSQYFVDYKKETDSVLYVNNEGEVMEKYLETGKEERIEIPPIPERLEEEKEEQRSFYGEEYGTMEEVRKDPSYYNVQYGPGEEEISFVYKGMLYIYNRERREIEEITECESSDHRNTYQWVSLEEVYILCREDSWTSLYQWRRGYENKRKIDGSVSSFRLNRDGKQVISSKIHAKSWDSVIELSEKMVIIDKAKGENIPIDDIGYWSRVNYVMEYVGDQYIIYIKQGKGKIKSKVYRLDMKTGRKKCIYWTYHEVVGVIVR